MIFVGGFFTFLLRGMETMNSGSFLLDTGALCCLLDMAGIYCSDPSWGYDD